MKSVSFLQRLQPETAELLHQAGVKRSWPRRACIFRVREPCTGIHLLLDGLVKLFRSSPGGREQIVLLEGAGSALTLAPVLDASDQIANAETLKASTTLFVPSDVFLQMFKERDDLRDAVVLDMARRLRMAFGLLETIALKPVIARIATRILDIAGSQDALDGSREFRMLLSQDELAHVLATSRESVARALAELRAQGIIEQRGAQVRILDAAVLLELSNVADQAATNTPFPAVT